MGPAHVDKMLTGCATATASRSRPNRSGRRCGRRSSEAHRARPARQAVRRARPVRGVPAGDRTAGTRRRHRVRRPGGRRRGAAPVHPLGREGRPEPVGEGGAHRLSGGRRPDHPGRRQGPLGRLVRHGVPECGGHRPARGRQRVDRVPARTDRHRRHHRRRRLGRFDPVRPARPPRTGARHRAGRVAGPHRDPRRGAGSSSCRGTPSTCARSSTGPAPSPAPSLRYDYLPADLAKQQVNA